MRKNKNILKKGMILAAVSTMVVTMAPAIPAYAYGEAESKTGQAAFNAATTESTDYQSWLTGTWQGGTQDFANTNKIALTPGSTAKDLGFAWYSNTKGTPAVMVWKDGSKAGAQIVKGTATDISAENWQGEVYAASNKVSINGFFEPDTKYVYQYTDNYSDNGDTVWSAEYTYTTHATDTFSVILTGDPQIGASGSKSDKDANDMSIAQDAYNWNKTMQKAMEIDPDASFLLSAGDQINESNAGSEETKKTRESEYAGYLYPSVFRSLPIAATIGNHDKDGSDYTAHFNNPNSEDNLGSTGAGCDFYFNNGNVIDYDLSKGSVNNPEGTLYITTGSGSGSKYYNLLNYTPYYIAERTNACLPSFSTIDFSSGTMTIKTYDYNGNKYADDFTITKTTDAQSADEVIAAADALVNSTDVAYTDESMEALKSALASLKELKASGTTADDPMVSDITTNYGTANDRVKGYGSIANDDDKDGAKNRFKRGISTLLDKTIYTQVAEGKEENLSDYSTDKAPVVKGIDEAKKAVVSAINALQVKQTAPNGNQNGNADQSGNGAQDSTNQNGNGAQGGAGQQIAGNNAGGSGSQNVSTANTGASKSDSDGVKTSKSAKVKTGDVNHGGMYAALGVLGAAILATVLGMRKKGKFWQK